MAKTLRYTLVKETSCGARRYMPSNANDIIEYGGVYLHKPFFNNREVPTHLIVTIEEEDVMMPGETIKSGAPSFCSDCKKRVSPFRVMRSGGGWYIGTSCDCGPYSRESHYYASKEEAEKALATDTVNYRTEVFNG